MACEMTQALKFIYTFSNSSFLFVISAIILSNFF